MESDSFLLNKSISVQEWDCLYGHLYDDAIKNIDITTESNEAGKIDSSDSPSSSSTWKLFNFLWGNNDDGGIFGEEEDELVARVAKFERGHSYSHTYYGSKHNQGSTGSSVSAANSLEISSSLRKELDGDSNSEAHILPHGFQQLLESSSSTSTHHEGRSGVCGRHWDGLLCWPETFEGQSVTLPCFRELGGITYDERGAVTRFCEEGGLWQNKTNYSACIPHASNTSDTETAAGGTHDVYFAGYCVSLFALTIAMVIFVVFKELRCLRNTIHTHLIITYILADTLWLITSITQSHFGQQTQVSCITFILLHYFHLTNFFWMFVEGLYLYVLVVQTFMAENVKLRVYASIGWGLPILIVVAWAVAKWLTQAPHSSLPKLDGEIEIIACIWLNVNLYDWIYKLPFIIVLAVNSIFLVQIMWVLITKLRSATSPETQQSRKAAKALVVLMPLLGITYVLVLRGSSQTPVYEIIRALLISTQGFLVALLYCFLNGEVRIALRHRWNRLRAMGSGMGCCEPRQMQNIRDWSPRSRTESIRLYTPTQLTPTHKKRESIASETTMTTVMGPTIGTAANGSNNSPQSLVVTTNPSRKLSATTTRTYNSMDNNLL